jgi:hypothetical protein
MDGVGVGLLRDFVVEEDVAVGEVIDGVAELFDGAGLFGVGAAADWK